ncbi:hypothetical protein [Nitrososphaera sp. AFS]|uniref:hypothetical protein n=1 Tax=Nitrososphaera sp. AFS TaxID=2301191 RepID=UPI00139247FC|nr:hypothetical protein [Nitrososphaera sp. AFS]NAL78177.1 hypothetical protein [Nitrososphaera sp. AFS]
MERSTNTPILTCATPILIERKLQAAVDGLPSDCHNVLCKKVLPYSIVNAQTIADYVLALKTEVNPGDHYRVDIIRLLSQFSIFFKNQKSFTEITRADLLAFLDTVRKPENLDPMHKWIGTYNLYRIHLMRFFKWLYYPDIEQKHRPKPPVIENIHKLARKEKSIYKPTDLWTEEDDFLFFKYCPSRRDRCYHAVSRDSSCRPHEILKLKIKDIMFKNTPDGKQYAEVLVNGKTGSRHIPLINSIPYLKDWLSSDHPQAGNPNAAFICGRGKSLGRRLSVGALYNIYMYYQLEFFPRLLENTSVLPEDKNKIRELLKKPWNPYIRRHSALTEKSLRLREHVLRQHAGWSGGSQMHLKYIHYFGNESSESILEEYGIVSKDKRLSDTLRPKQCPNCNEPNKPDSRFCAKCRMVLTYDAYNETLENQQEKESEIRRLQEKYEHDIKVIREETSQQFKQIISMIQQNPVLAHVKPEALTKKIQ